MKSIMLFLVLFIASFQVSFAQTEFELDPNQNMLMTGKGQGQDGAINPYLGEDCYAIIENIGKSSFSIRIQENGELIRSIDISPKESKRIKMLKGHELYFDSDEKEKANVSLIFEKIKD